MAQMLIIAVVRVTAVICATILAAKKREGWGWLIFLAIVI